MLKTGVSKEIVNKYLQDLFGVEDRKYDEYDVLDFITKLEKEKDAYKKALKYYADSKHNEVEIEEFKKMTEEVVDRGEVAQEVMEHILAENKDLEKSPLTKSNEMFLEK